MPFTWPLEMIHVNNGKKNCDVKWSKISTYLMKKCVYRFIHYFASRPTKGFSLYSNHGKLKLLPVS